MTVTWLSSALARPEMDASELVSGVPSYFFSAEPVVTVAEAGFTVNVPSCMVIFVNCSVTSSPSALLIV